MSNFAYLKLAKYYPLNPSTDTVPARAGRLVSAEITVEGFAVGTTMQQEEWRAVEGFEGSYEVSNIGRVRSLDRLIITSYRPKGSRIRGTVLFGRLDHNGYPVVSLWRHQKAITVKVHRLVARAFLGDPIPPAILVNHKNGRKVDNRVENLEWVTPSQNNNHAYATGLAKGVRGEKNHLAKLTEDQVRVIIERIDEGFLQEEIAREFGVSAGTVSAIAQGRVWMNVPRPQGWPRDLRGRSNGRRLRSQDGRFVT